MAPNRDGTDEIQIVEPLCAVFRRALKAEGLKYTPERAHILDAVLRMDRIFEVDQLLAATRDAGFRVSKATIYRTIRLLQDAGIVQRVWFDDDHACYQLVYGRGPSALLIRVDSGEIESIDLPQLDRAAQDLCAARGLTHKGHRIQIFAARS